MNCNDFVVSSFSGEDLGYLRSMQSTALVSEGQESCVFEFVVSDGTGIRLPIHQSTRHWESVSVVAGRDTIVNCCIRSEQCALDCLHLQAF